MAIWLFENRRFTEDAWVPFDRDNQKKLEFIYRHYDTLIQLLKKSSTSSTSAGSMKQGPLQEDDSSGSYGEDEEEEDFCIVGNEDLYAQMKDEFSVGAVDLNEEDPAALKQLQYSDRCLSIALQDSHFQDTITLYPYLLLGCLPDDNDVLIARIDRVDVKY